ncbi:MAG TPA: hypothetical protein VME17_05735 [Bryobacteraceae bacterium]|nr:hypothetical protein [Bryobacteraceae bacterium]
MRVLISIAVLISTAYSSDFTTYIGDANQYQVAAVAADSAGSRYVTGSRVIPLPGDNPSSDVFVTKLDPTGAIAFTTTFGGKGLDQGMRWRWIHRATSGQVDRLRPTISRCATPSTLCRALDF